MSEQTHRAEDSRTVVPSEVSRGGPRCGCANADPAVAAAAERNYVYAIGRIQARVPTLGLEKELAQLVGRTQTAGLTDRETLSAVLSDRANRYIARRICWVLSIEGIDTYILKPQDDAGLEQLVESLRGAPRPTDLDVVIGRRNGLSSPSTCNGLVAPLVVTEQVYSFDINSLIDGLPGCPTEQEHPTGQRAAAEEVFYRLAAMADNAGATDEQRAVDYLTVRYPAMYALAADYFRRSYALSSVNVQSSKLATSRKLVDVVFTFTHRTTETSDRHACRVDVTEEYPFLASKLSPYFNIA